jgi:hypothetical protein
MQLSHSITRNGACPGKGYHFDITGYILAPSASKVKFRSPIPLLAPPSSSISPMSRSTKITSPMSFTRMTVDTRVPYHLPSVGEVGGTSGFFPISVGCKHVQLFASASEVSGMV